MRWAAFEDAAYAAMRIIVAFLYLSHGLQKALGLFGGHAVPPDSLLGSAGLIETVLGPLLLVGLFTRWAAFLACGEMAVAYFTQHAPRGGLPVQNQGELAVAFCFVFLFVLVHGGGALSLDRVLRRRS